MPAAGAKAAREAPALQALVAAGKLPPLEQRLPENPLVIAPVEKTGKYGGTWRSGLRGGQDTAWLTRTVNYEHLVRWSPDWSQVVPNVAESFSSNADATEFTFKLRKGMKWSDGAPFTADDIVFWSEDILNDPEYSKTHPPSAYLRAGGKTVTVSKIDETTVVFRFAAPNGLFLQRLATPEGDQPTRWPRHYAMQFHPRYNKTNLDALIKQAGATNWVNLMELKAGNVQGTPYDAKWQNVELPTLHAWRFTTAYGAGAKQVVAERNPFYWKVDTAGNQLPYLDRLVWEIGDDVQVLVLKALNGEMDMQDRHIGIPANKAVFVDGQQKGGYGFFEVVPSSMNDMIIALNLTHKDPVKRQIFQNKDFRIGLSYAINRKEIIDVVWVGQGEPWQLAPRPTSPFYNERLAKQYTEYSVAKANEHLDKAFPRKDAEGFRLGPDGKRISFVVEVTNIQTERVNAMELIVKYWRAVGIDVQSKSEDRSLMYTRKDHNDHDAAVWGGDGGLDVILEPRWYFPYSGESLFAEAWKEYYTNPSGVGSLVKPEEPPAATRQQMELYRQLIGTGDQAKQAQLMKQILEIAADQFYAIGIGLTAPQYGIVRNNFKNVPRSMPGAWLYPNPAPTNTAQYYIE
jgi:peptide/nickel transport system substrate-binding protein